LEDWPDRSHRSHSEPCIWTNISARDFATTSKQHIFSPFILQSAHLFYRSGLPHRIQTYKSPRVRSAWRRIWSGVPIQVGYFAGRISSVILLAVGFVDDVLSFGETHTFHCDSYIVSLSSSCFESLPLRSFHEIP
jgi:hypothetical protein